jgi:hypothetical protein
MKETFSRNKDTIMLVLLVAGLAGVAFQGGAFLVEVAKWPLMIALLVGIVFASYRHCAKPNANRRDHGDVDPIPRFK